ncbi:hypothetical protein PG984_001718 [Apiospora sp. TS-2023a]
MSSQRDSALYNGVSQRLRGWKSRKSDKHVGAHISTNPTVMRWDGAARSSTSWDSLRRDPELWYREGDCYVHLYGRGQSQRGPAFKIPFAALLKADCYPLVEKYICQDVVEPTTFTSSGHKKQAYRFHLATRNFFAFLFRRSLVGEHLGSALITLAETMHLFRNPDVDNLSDLMSYMDEEGYLYLKSQPSHALAILHLAEVLQIRDLYINAFAHCCVTRRLIRRAKVEMELRLGQMGSMLKTFLQDELSEAHLGLNPGARAHLERFRTLLQGVYATKFGYYPPPSIDPRTTVFELDVFRVMSRDFEALYRYLVNEDLDSTQGSRPCRSHSPLLPQLQPTTISKRTSWFGIYTKPGATQKANTHVALLKATNQSKMSLLDNDLVRAYRKFEEDSIYNPLKADRLENLSPVDARKVRWILIYTVHQCLRQVMQPPPEIRDPADTPYHLCISTTNIPPWKDELPVHPNFQKQLTEITRNPSISTLRWSAFSGYQTPPLTPGSPDIRAEIKPDIDYFALSRQRNASDTKLVPSNPRTPTKRSSLTKSLREKRRSLGLFKASQTEAASPQANRKSAQYHEIVVHGYGNGTNDVEFTSQPLTPVEVGSDSYTTRASSTAASETGGSTDGTNSEHGTTSTKATSIADSSCVESPTPMTPTLPPANHNHFSWASRRSSICVQARSRVDADNFDTVSPPPRSATICAKSPPRLRRNLQMPAKPSGFPKQRSQSVHGRYRKSMEPLPLQIRKTSREEADAILRASRPRPVLEASGESDATITPTTASAASTAATAASGGNDVLQMPVPSSPTVWDDIKALMEVRASRLGFPSGTGDDILPEWDMYGLGGLTEPKP